jgi:tRNA(Ile)-lysidine synthase
VSKDTPAPITNDEADAAFACLERFDHVVLAVSGGPDSMALMVLAAEWRKRQMRNRSVLSVATVDHGLRAESRAEAEQVSSEAVRLGLPHVTLPWTGEKPHRGLPMKAREARYRLLQEFAGTLGSENVAVVTAHHRDDQAETVVMRLARGAGVDGLSGMRRERALNDRSPVTLVRPLLGFPKARLIATLSLRGVAFAADPTNSDTRFERARVRSRQSLLETAGISAEALALTARRLGDARDALAFAERLFVASLGLSFANEIFAKLDRGTFDAGPVFLRQKVLSKLIDRFGGASPAPQLSEVEDLVARMQREGAVGATLGGAMISAGARHVRVWREAGRLSQPDFTLSPGQEAVWDRRFLLRLATGYREDGVAGGVTVRALGREAYAAIVPRLAPSRRPPTRAAIALPSFWAGGTLLAAPSLAPFAVLNSPPLDPSGCEINPLAKTG